MSFSVNTIGRGAARVGSGFKNFFVNPATNRFRLLRTGLAAIMFAGGLYGAMDRVQNPPSLNAGIVLTDPTNMKYRLDITSNGPFKKFPEIEANLNSGCVAAKPVRVTPSYAVAEIDCFDGNPGNWGFPVHYGELTVVPQITLAAADE